MIRRCMPLFILTAAGLCAPAVAQTPAPAQGATPPAEVQSIIHLAAANQLGILEYCESNHFVGLDAVTMQRNQIAALPPVSVAGMAEAEAAGRQGFVQSGGQRISLADAASRQSTTVPAVCAQIVQLMEQQQGGHEGSE